MGTLKITVMGLKTHHCYSLDLTKKRAFLKEKV